MMRAFLIYWRTAKPKYNNTAEWWDARKVKVKALTIAHCVKKAKEQRTKEYKLPQELTELKRHTMPDIEAIAEIERQITELQSSTKYLRQPPSPFFNVVFRDNYLAS